jgi:hypothetical protein
MPGPADLRAVRRPFPTKRMAAHPANPIVNKATTEGPDCLIPTS